METTKVSDSTIKCPKRPYYRCYGLFFHPPLVAVRRTVSWDPWGVRGTVRGEETQQGSHNHKESEDGVYLGTWKTYSTSDPVRVPDEGPGKETRVQDNNRGLNLSSSVSSVSSVSTYRGWRVPEPRSGGSPGWTTNRPKTKGTGVCPPRRSNGVNVVGGLSRLSISYGEKDQVKTSD